MTELGFGFILKSRSRRARWSAADLLADEFTTAQSPPLTSPRVAEPGPGILAITDTENKLSIAGGKLVMDKRATATWNDPGLYFTRPVARAPGNAVFLTYIAPASGQVRIGWNATPSSYPYYDFLDAEIGPAQSPFTAGTEYERALVSRGLSGWMDFVRGGVFTDWTLRNVVAYSPEALVCTRYLGIANYSAVNFRLNGIRAQLLGGSWEQEGLFNKAGLFVPTTADGETAIGVAEGIVEHTVVIQDGVIQDFEFRRTDENNALILRIDTPAGRVRLMRRQSGAETELSSGPYSYTAGTAKRFYVRLYGTKVQSLATAGVEATTSFNQTATGMRVSHAGTALAAWPATGWTLTQAPSAFRAAEKCFFAYGDSKTANSPSYHHYIPYYSGAVAWPAAYGVGGRNTSQAAANVDADLAAIGADKGPPAAVLINLGANDSTIDATWKTNAGYVLDAMHGKWANAAVCWVVTWTRGHGFTFSNDQRAALEELIATRAWAHLGIDESVVLENGDNGATMTSDGTHMSAAGAKAEAQAWKTVLAW